MEIAYKIDPSKVFWKKVEDETIILNHKTDSYFVLDELAGLIWEMLSDKKDPDQIVNRVCEEYSVGTEEAKKDINELLEDFKQQGLFEA